MQAAIHDGGRARQSDEETDRADQQQAFAADPVDQIQRRNREQEVGRADQDRLLIRRHFAEAGGREDVVDVIENGVDAGELIEGGDAERQQDGFAVFGPAQPPILRRADGSFRQDCVFFRLRDAGRDLAQDFLRFGAPASQRQPARALRDGEKHREQDDARAGPRC